MTRATRHCFNHRGLSLSYLDTGNGSSEHSVALLLHGFPDQATMWAPQIAALRSAGYRCIAPDTVGCGRSAIAPRLRNYNCVTIAGDHIALLDYLGLEKVHVVGHDWGAVIAWLLAGHFPARVRSLIAMSVGHPTAYARSGLRQKRLAWYTYFFTLGALAERLLLGAGRFSLRNVFHTHPDRDEVMERLRQPGRMRAALRIYRAAIVPVFLTRQPDVTVPTLGLWSDGDQFLTEAQMLESQRYSTGGWRYQRLVGHHWMSLQQPEEVNPLIIEHLRKCF